jgi:hypothetical protein
MNVIRSEKSLTEGDKLKIEMELYRGLLPALKALKNGFGNKAKGFSKSRTGCPYDGWQLNAFSVQYEFVSAPALTLLRIAIRLYEDCLKLGKESQIKSASYNFTFNNGEAKDDITSGRKGDVQFQQTLLEVVEKLGKYIRPDPHVCSVRKPEKYSGENIQEFLGHQICGQIVSDELIMELAHDIAQSISTLGNMLESKSSVEHNPIVDSGLQTSSTASSEPCIFNGAYLETSAIYVAANALLQLKNLPVRDTECEIKLENSSP